MGRLGRSGRNIFVEYEQSTKVKSFESAWKVVSVGLVAGMSL